MWLISIHARASTKWLLGGKQAPPFFDWCTVLDHVVGLEVSQVSKRFRVKIGLTSGRFPQVSTSDAPPSQKPVRSCTRHRDKNSDKTSPDITKVNWLLSWLTPSRRARRNKVVPAMSSEEQQELDALEDEFISQQSPNRKPSANSEYRVVSNLSVVSEVETHAHNCQSPYLPPVVM